MHAAHTYDSRILKVASKGVERRALREGKGLAQSFLETRSDSFLDDIHQAAGTEIEEAPVREVLLLPEIGLVLGHARKPRLELAVREPGCGPLGESSGSPWGTCPSGMRPSYWRSSTIRSPSLSVRGMSSDKAREKPAPSSTTSRQALLGNTTATGSSISPGPLPAWDRTAEAIAIQDKRRGGPRRSTSRRRA